MDVWGQLAIVWVEYEPDCSLPWEGDSVGYGVYIISKVLLPAGE